MPNVEVNRSKEGTAPAPQETCLTQESVPTIGYASNLSVTLVLVADHVDDHLSCSRLSALVNNSHDIP